jgi:hypothetical protein
VTACVDHDASSARVLPTLLVVKNDRFGCAP